LHFELIFQFLLFLSQLLLNLLEQAGLVQIELFWLFASHHKLTLVIIVFLSCLWVLFISKLRGGTLEVVETFVHKGCDLRAELLPFLVPAPLVNLGFAQSRLFGDLQKGLLAPVRVFVKFSHKGLQLVSALPLSLADQSLKLAIFIQNILLLLILRIEV
jgi:hypothetical protein